MILMKAEKISEKENPFMKRKEFSFSIEHDASATPRKAELQQYLAKEMKKNPEQIEIKSIFSDIGVANSKARVFVWEENKVEDLSKVAKAEAKKEEKKSEEERVVDGEKRDYGIEKAPAPEAKEEEKPAEKEGVSAEGIKGEGKEKAETPEGREEKGEKKQ